MSLIVTRKENGVIYIVSDTKLTAPDGQDFNKGQHYQQEENVLKATILNSHHCVSFAGNIQYAESAIKSLTGDQTDETILDILRLSHLASNQETEYTLASMLNTKAGIYEIKNGTVSKVEASWIGSQKAFGKFQSNMLGQNLNHKRQNFMSITKAASGNLMQKMTDAMDDVIQDEDIPEVAGFKIKIFFDGNRFIYDGYIDSYFASQQLNFQVPDSANSFGMPITHGTAAQGAYTINFFLSRDNYNYVGLHVKQGNFGILYCRNDNGLLHPELLAKTDEIDFWDQVKKFGVTPFGTTQDAFQKFGIAGKDFYDQKNYLAAINSFTKGIEYTHDKEKGQLYFNRAICFIQINKMQEVLQDFNEAVKLKPENQAEATRIMTDLINSKR
ncbi:hypothetical protein SNE25_20580 [Mucilaginibacter sabulilitoris]|uniref:Tetratricopeptide repeat protein n=1 Tax=Mucilaginibacter sabulilitoris TaxID=1173583 RepID=A0ABZ0THP6_9SPHI|nr:hypothetical protein [Mucilaginibacter sabulilitoris]WPU91718.1 hypothetical protein SNE25_20580 [Mucilaginibacter sabulilitoris]